MPNYNALTEFIQTPSDTFETAAAAAAYLRVTPTSMSRWIRLGLLHHPPYTLEEVERFKSDYLHSSELKVKDAAKIIGITEAAVYQYLEEGKLHRITNKKTKRIRLDSASVNRMAQDIHVSEVCQRLQIDKKEAYALIKAGKLQQGVRWHHVTPESLETLERSKV